MIDVLVPTVVLLVVVFFVGLQVLHAWGTGRWSAQDRYRLVADAVDSIVVLALVRALAPPLGPWSWVWVLAVAAVGFALAGAALRWRTLPWDAPKPKRKLDAHGATIETPSEPRVRQRQIMAGGLAAVGIAVVALCW